MKPVQRRGFFNFMFSFMPGASEMYMGFTKMGLSIMSAFLLSIGIIGLLSLADLFIIIPIIIWFYGFFHARNLTVCPPEEFMTIKDEFFWNEFTDGKIMSFNAEKVRSWGSIALILVGLGMLWNIVWDPISDYLRELMYSTNSRIAEYILHIIYSLPRLAFAVVIIIIGIKLILGKKKTLYYIEDKSQVINAGAELSKVSTEEGERKDA